MSDTVIDFSEESTEPGATPVQQKLDIALLHSNMSGVLQLCILNLINIICFAVEKDSMKRCSLMSVKK